MNISVIIPMYNAARTISRCVRSVLCQPDQVLEILLIDDGSEDGTPALCQSLWPDDPRVRLLFQAHGGVSAARNRGLNEAKGDWILFLDADDALAEGALAAFEPYLGGDFDAICGRVARGTRAGARARAEGLAAIYGADRRRALFDRVLADPTNELTCHAWLFNQRLRRAKGVAFDPQLRFGEDSDWVLRFLRVCGRVCFIPQTVYLYTVSNESTLHHWRPGKTEGFLRTIERLAATPVAGERNWPAFVLTNLLLILTHDTFHPDNPASAGEASREVRRLCARPVIAEALRRADWAAFSLPRRLVLLCLKHGWLSPVRWAVRLRQYQNNHAR